MVARTSEDRVVALVNELRSCATVQGPPAAVDLVSLLTRAADEIERLSDRQTWKPIRQLPPKGLDCLTLDEHGKICNDRKIHPGYWQDGDWIPGVVGWMPVPLKGRSVLTRRKR